MKKTLVTFIVILLIGNTVSAKISDTAYFIGTYDLNDGKVFMSNK